LNAGHQLYALTPGDRPVWINPPYWTVPLLSPPPIAVVWRLLAGVPAGLGFDLWWLTCVSAIVGVIVTLARRLPFWTGLAVLIAAPSLAWELGVANVNGLLLAGVVATWLLARSNRDGWAGALIALMVAVKVWPIVLLAWFVAQNRPRAIGGFLVGGSVVALMSLIGAGVPAHLQYLEVLRATPPSAASLAGMLAVLGLSVPWISYALLGFGILEIWALRARPELTFAVTIGVMVMGSPVVNINTYAIMLACLAPFAWRLGRAATGIDAAVIPSAIDPFTWKRAMAPSLARISRSP
jgi:hypothetical protein